MSEPDTQEVLPYPKRSFAIKYAIACCVVAAIILVLLNVPPKEVVIQSPALTLTATPEAYFDNLETIDAYAQNLHPRMQKHPKFRRLKMVDYQGIKSNAQRLLEANPALAKDEAMWRESQTTAVNFLKRLETVDYALTASGL